MGTSLSRRAAAALIAICLLLPAAGVARADEVTSKGTVLQGKINRISAAGVELSPDYGDGSLLIKWKNVEDIHSEASFQILYNDEQEVYAPLTGFRDGMLQTQEASIDVKTIHSGIPLSSSKPSFRERLRSNWRYWDGNFDLALNASQATVDTTGLLVSFAATRTKDPTRLVMNVSYRFSRQNSDEEVLDPNAPGGTKTKKVEKTLEDEWRGLLRGEYDLTPRIYTFASADAEYDGIESLSIRAVPKLGLGYQLWEQEVSETKKNFLRVEAGGAYVYEKFFGGDTGDYFSIAMGALAQYHLPFGRVDWRLDYLPAVNDWIGDYLLRTEAALSIPIFDPISLKTAIIDEYDSEPAEGTDQNRFYLMLGFSVAW